MREKQRDLRGSKFSILYFTKTSKFSIHVDSDVIYVYINKYTFIYIYIINKYTYIINNKYIINKYTFIYIYIKLRGTTKIFLQKKAKNTNR